MLTETEVRSYRDNLRLALETRCACSNPRHSTECAEGKRMMQSAINALSWVLGENVREDLMVKYMARFAAEHHGGR